MPAGSSNFPESLDNDENLPDPSGAELDGDGNAHKIHSNQHATANDGIIAVERKLGPGLSDAENASTGSAIVRQGDGTTVWQRITGLKSASPITVSGDVTQESDFIQSLFDALVAQGIVLPPGGGGSDPGDPDPGGGGGTPGGGVPPVPVDDGVTGAGATPTRTVNVANTSQLTAAFSGAANGDRIILANGSYNAAGFFTLTAKNNVTIEAANVGMAVIGTSSQMQFASACDNVLISGIKFAGITNSSSIKVTSCTDFRIEKCTFDQSGVTTSSHDLIFLTADTQRVTITRNLFQNKNDVSGNFVHIEGNDTTGQVVRDVWIHRNHMRDIGPRKENEMEAIQYGNTDYTASSAVGTANRAIIEWNLFERCDGDPELMTLKCDDLTIRHNTFFDNHATCVVMRQGNNGSTYGNWMFGGTDEARPGGGIRIYGSNRKVFNNYIANMLGTGFEAAMNIDGGDTTAGGALNGHWQVVNAEVVHNTLVNNAVGLQIGKNYTLAVKDSRIADNIVVKSTAGPCYDAIKATNVTYAKNIARATGSATAASSNITGGVISTDPVMTAGIGGIQRPLESGPVAGQASQTYSYRTFDIDGQTLGSPADIGCDEVPTPATPAFLPVSATTVGPGSTGGGNTGGGGGGGGGDPTPPSGVNETVAATIFVATSGSDSNNGTSSGTPFATLRKALTVVQPGGIIQLANGTYSGDTAIPTVRDGTSTNRIVVRAASKGGAIIDGGNALNNRLFEPKHSYYRFRGIKFTNSEKLVYTDASSNCIWEDCIFDNCGGEIFRLKHASNNNEIRYCEFNRSGRKNFTDSGYIDPAGTDNGECVYVGTSPNQTTTVDNCRDNWVHHCKFTNIGSEAINSKEGSTGLLVEHCDAVSGGWQATVGNYNLQGESSTIRYNRSQAHAGTGARTGEASPRPDGQPAGVNNSIYGNVFTTGNALGGVKIQKQKNGQLSPVGNICGNTGGATPMYTGDQPTSGQTSCPSGIGGGTPDYANAGTRTYTVP